jgi:Ca2+-binding RTX toxin-like protein
MDLDNVERIAFEALGGSDNIVVNDLTKTDVQQVEIDLSATPHSGAGDGFADTVIVTGTADGDHVTVANNGGSITVSGLSAQVTIDGAEAANDTLVINTLGGNDTIDASAILLRTTIDGGAGNDTIIGSQGADLLIGGDGNDTITGGRGNDVALLGNGNDTFVWNPGDGSDTVEGQAGADTLVFNGANVGENIDISANGPRARLFRDVGSVTMDLNDIEHIQLAALGGADTISVEDLTGTDVTQVAIDLSATAGSGTGDGAADTVIVNATAGADQVKITNSSAFVVVNGLAAQVTINGVESGTDSLVVNGGAGNDTIDASKLAASQVNSRSTGATATTG